MKQRDETTYTQGERMAWLKMLKQCLRELGYADPEARAVSFVAEREAAVNQLRSICRDFGDNDWPEEAHLADVIDKHLGDHLRAPEGKVQVVPEPPFLYMGKRPEQMTREELIAAVQNLGRLYVQAVHIPIPCGI
jgi:hypothetical protein